MEAKMVAKYFLNRANHEGDLITNLKMQKLLYYAQAWYLVNFKDKELFEDVIEAWDFGPVIPSVYHQFKEFRHTPIDYDVSDSSIKNIKDEDKEYLEEFYNKFINYSACDLVNMSHNEDPWKEAFNSPSNVIVANKMREYYTNLYKKNRKEQKK